jgi:proline iminopeptidase
LVLCATAASYRFLQEAKAFLRANGTPEQNRVAQRLWDGQFENDEQLKEFFRALGPLYSRKFDLAEFEESWPRRILTREALNRGFGDFMRRFDFTGQLEAIRCPTLVLGSEGDWICPAAQSRLIAQRIPGAELKMFHNSGHLIAQDENEAYLAAVRGFFEMNATTGV